MYGSTIFLQKITATFKFYNSISPSEVMHAFVWHVCNLAGGFLWDNNSFTLFAFRNEKKDCKRKRDKDGEDGMDVEGRYEERVSESEPKRTKHLLPIKTKGGLVFRSVTEDFSGMETILHWILHCRTTASQVIIITIIINISFPSSTCTSSFTRLVDLLTYAFLFCYFQ